MPSEFTDGGFLTGDYGFLTPQNELVLVGRVSSFVNVAGRKVQPDEVERIRKAAKHAHGLGMMVAAGHGLTYRNVGALAAIPEIVEFNIGHNIISRSVFVGLNQAVREMIEAIRST